MSNQDGRLSFGVFIPPHHRLGDNPSVAMRRVMELVEWCDELGYDEAWIGEHHSTGHELIGDPFLIMAAVAERTRRIRLGPGVVSLPYHHPLIVADRIVQFDHMTMGRALLGVGPGALTSDADMMGISPPTQRPRMNEALGMILRLLQGEVVTHKTDWFELREAQLQLMPYQAGGIPVACASTTTPSGVVSVGMYGTGVLALGAGFVGGKKDLAGQWAIAEETAAKFGRVMDRADWRPVMRVHLAETRKDAMDQVRGLRQLERDQYFGPLLGISNDFTLEQEVEDGSVIIGTPEDAIAAIRALEDSTGGFGTFVILAHEWANRMQTLNSYELFARYVIPEFQQALVAPRASAAALTRKQPTWLATKQEALTRAFTDAGREVPASLDLTKNR